MDGSIDVDSVYGKGSTFVVTLDQRIGTELQVSKEVKKKNINVEDYYRQENEDEEEKGIH